MTRDPTRVTTTRIEFVRADRRSCRPFYGWSGARVAPACWCCVAILLLWLAVGELHAAPRGRTPTPPAAEGSGPIKRFLGASYLDLRPWVATYGLTSRWLETGRRLQLTSDYTTIVVEADRREVTVNGMRVYLGEPIVASAGTLWLGTVDARDLLGPILRPAGVAGMVPGLRVICLDPGHGGNDTGTQNKALKLDEKRLTLDVAQRVKTQLEAKGYKVIMTRTTDRYVELEDRADYANRARADLFVSIHFNAFPQPSVHGTETYILTRRGQRSSSSSKRENSDNIGLPGHGADPWNAVLGYALHRQLITKLGSLDRGLKFARFKVLTLINCPGILLESGYLSNDAEGRKIATPAYRAELANAIVVGIDNYAAQLKRARE